MADNELCIILTGYGYQADQPQSYLRMNSKCNGIYMRRSIVTLNKLDHSRRILRAAELEKLPVDALSARDKQFWVLPDG
jgi:hypothetical protein